MSATYSPLTRPAAVALAREFYETGAWSYAQIRDHLEERGVRVHAKTVRRWVDTEYERACREANRPYGRKYRRAQRSSRVPRVADADAVVTRVGELHAAGLDVHGIRIVVKVDLDVDLSGQSVTHVIEHGELPERIARMVQQ